VMSVRHRKELLSKEVLHNSRGTSISNNVFSHSWVPKGPLLTYKRIMFEKHTFSYDTCTWTCLISLSSTCIKDHGSSVSRVGEMCYFGHETPGLQVTTEPQLGAALYSASSFF
jgi:hypothetical protein